jgi:VCBS repeat-containing protein
VSTAEDTPVSGQVVATDVEGSPLTYSLDSGPANGSVTVNGDGTWTYTPDADYNGPDSFTVIVSDGNGGTTTSTVNIGVTAVNDGPVANADSFTVAEDGQLAIDVLDNDTDVDGDSLTITQVNGKAITEGGAAVSVANGSVALVNGALVFKPAPDYNGGITFSYTVSDGVASSTATVQGRVTPVADPQPTPPAASTPPAVAPSPAPVVDRAPVANREPAAHTGHTSSLGTINNQGTELFVSEAVGSTQFEASMLTAGAISGQTDRVLIAEGMAQLPDNMLLVNTGTSDLVPDLALKSLDSFGSFVPAVYVQHAVRYEALTSDHGLFVQKVVQATQLESRLNDLRITAQSRQMDAFDHIPGDSFGEMAFQADSSAEAPEARQAPSKLEELPLPEPEDAGDPSGESTEAEGSDAASTVVELRPAAAKGFRAQLQAFEQARKTSALSGVRRYG